MRSNMFGVSPNKDTWGKPYSTDFAYNYILYELDKKLTQTVLKVRVSEIKKDVRYYLHYVLSDKGDASRVVRYRLVYTDVKWLNPFSRSDLLRIMAYLISMHCLTPSGNSVDGWETVTKYAPY